MKISALAKKVFDIYMRRAALALALGTLTASFIFPGTAVALDQITSCVEVPEALVAASAKRASSFSDCDPQTAFNSAHQQSQGNSRDALAPICLERISVAEAEEVCSAANGSILTTGTSSLQAPPIARAGSSRVDSQLHISQSNPKLCVVLRDLPNETETTNQPAGINNGFCIFNGGRATTKKVRTRARCGVQCSDVHQHQLQVSRFTTAVLTNADADRILEDSTSVLKTDDGSGDVACSVTFSRVGSVTTFATGDGSIDSDGELNTVHGLSGNVKVVDAINFCGKLQPNVIGCARPGNSIAVTRVDNLEGILWSHELGHASGLDHRNNQNAVMNGQIGNTRRRVTSAECSAYRISLVSASAFAQAAGPSQAGEVPAPEVPAPEARPIDIKQFVRQMFIHGVSYEEATKYPSDVMPTLLEMLNDRTEEPHWANIVVVLGMIGDERALDQMIAFIERDRGRISATHYRAKSAAIMSLGYLINKTGSLKALDYLTRGLDPKVWSTRAGIGLAPYQATTIERNHDFAKHVILGLALSGHPEAARALRSLQQPSDDEGLLEFRAQVSDLVAEALKEHQQVASRGLADYYRSQ